MSGGQHEDAKATPTSAAGTDAETKKVGVKQSVNSKITIAVASRLGNGVVMRARRSVTMKRLAGVYAKLTKTPVKRVHLSYKNRFLADDETLADVGVEKNKIIEVHDVLGIAEYDNVEYIFCH